jgi:hypothetical protein
VLANISDNNIGSNISFERAGTAAYIRCWPFWCELGEVSPRESKVNRLSRLKKESEGFVVNSC